MTDLKIQATNYYEGRRKPVRLIVAHAMQTGETSAVAEAVAAGWARADSRRASANLCVDDNSAVICVDDDDTPWAASGANSDGWHVEHAGMSDQDRAHWLDPYGRRMLAISANRAARRAVKWHIPVRKLTVAQVRDGVTKGFTDHATVQLAFPSTGHTDPGPYFPWDFWLGLIRTEILRLDPPAVPAPRVPSLPEQDTSLPAWYGRQLKEGMTGRDVRTAKHNLHLPLTGDLERDLLFDRAMGNAVAKLQHDQLHVVPNRRIAAREARVIG